MSVRGWDADDGLMVDCTIQVIVGHWNQLPKQRFHEMYSLVAMFGSINK